MDKKPRLTDADALLEDLKQSHDWLLNIYEGLQFETEKRVCSAEISAFNEIGLRIKAAPTVEAEPVRHGRWVDDCTNIVCSKRKAEYSDEIVFMNRRMEAEDLKFCPNCGAKMGGGVSHD